jgi:hypothetical protein
MMSDKLTRLVKIKKTLKGKELALAVNDHDTAEKLKKRIEQVFPGKTVEDVENMVAEMVAPSDRDLLVRIQPSFFTGQVDVLFQERDEQDRLTTHIERHFVRGADGKLLVNHDTFMMDKTGTGFAKEFLRNSMQVYQKTGVDEITLTTAQVGAYAWARFGFAPDEQTWSFKRGRYLSELEVMNDVPREVRQSLINAINSEGPKAIWKLADARYKDINIGKRVLIDNGWPGHLRLADKEAMARFNAYVGA